MQNLEWSKNIKTSSTHKKLAGCAKKEKQQEYVQGFLNSLVLGNKCSINFIETRLFSPKVFIHQLHGKILTQE